MWTVTSCIYILHRYKQTLIYLLKVPKVRKNTKQQGIINNSKLNTEFKINTKFNSFSCNSLPIPLRNGEGTCSWVSGKHPLPTPQGTWSSYSNISHLKLLTQRKTRLICLHTVLSSSAKRLSNLFWSTDLL